MARVISGLILFLSVGVALAGEMPLKSVLNIDGVKVAFLTLKSHSLSISSSCKKGEVFDCAAYAAFKRRETAPLNSAELEGGRNPGTLRCRKLGGEVKIAVAENLDETSVCKFSDGSIIDCGSL